ncbi:MAG: hypothetical protein AXA67_10105 [Methylothermaceae bacteria B42]|nr:MAG: hypothetical protein AXA67_10105 [Methylothermaceae bacteria B42]HHJ40412.1 hypothetical protein [Methylothermaceae bacterium]
MLSKLIYFCLAALSLSPVTAYADDLLDIYQLALQNDPTFRAAQASLRAGLEEKNLGRAGLLPKVDIKAGLTFTRTENLGQFPIGGVTVPNNTKSNRKTKNWGASLNQPIFDLTAWFRFQRGQQLTQKAQVQFAADQQSLILRVVEAYIEVLRARANLGASTAQEIATKRQLDQTRQRFDVGLAAITDVREAEAAHDLALANRLADEGALQVAKEQLSVLTGRQHSQLAVLKEDYPVAKPEPLNLDKWIQFAQQHNYDIKVAEYGQKAALQAARAAGAEHFPKINVNAGFDQTHSDIERNNTIRDNVENLEIDTTEGTVSLNLNMPLFAGGGISAARRKAYAEYDKANEEYLGAKRNTIQDTRAQYINVMTSIARVNAGKKAVISSRASLEATEAGYEVGTRNIVDVLDAVRTLHSAIKDYANARLDYVLANLRLKRRAGTLSPEDLIQLNQWLTDAATQENAISSAKEASRATHLPKLD